MRSLRALACSSLVVASSACSRAAVPPATSTPHVAGASEEEAGRYLFLIGGCNDCHTPGWAASNGHVAVEAWAVGSPVGYRGPWGTTYAPNLRLVAANQTPRQWVLLFREGAGLPPMPWPNYRDANEADLLAIRQFLRSLGPRGTPAPEALPPGQEPRTPYVDLRPKSP